MPPGTAPAVGVRRAAGEAHGVAAGGALGVAISRQSSGRALGARLALHDRHRDAGAAYDDLAPAESIGEGVVRKGDARRLGRDRAGQGGLEATHQPHRGKAANPGRKRQPGLDRCEFEVDVVGGQAQVERQLVAGRHAGGLDLLVGD
jgi:hypothetical protein